MVQANLVEIEPSVLEYILRKSAPRFNLTENTEELVQFMMDIIHDATHIKADKKEILKSIDLSIHSLTRFNGITHGKQTKTGW